MASTSPPPTLTFTWESLKQAFYSLGLNPKQRLLAEHYIDGLEEGYPEGEGPESMIAEIVHIAFGIAGISDEEPSISRRPGSGSTAQEPEPPLSR